VEVRLHPHPCQLHLCWRTCRTRRKRALPFEGAPAFLLGLIVCSGPGPRITLIDHVGTTRGRRSTPCGARRPGTDRFWNRPDPAPAGSSRSVSGVPLWLDPKGRKDQGGEEIGYLRSISAKIFETRSVPAFRRSDSEDFCPLRFCSGRAADFFKAGGLRPWRWS
jgi:hypothetical protein